MNTYSAQPFFIHPTPYLPNMFINFKNGLLTIISVSSLMLGTNFFIKPDAAVAGGFTETCNDIQHVWFAGNLIMSARCLPTDKGNPTRKNTEINLSALLKTNPNVYGALEWTTDANMNLLPDFTAQNCDPNTLYLGPSNWGLQVSAVCRGSNGTATGEYPNAVISNQDGQLTYDLIPGRGRIRPQP